MDGRITLEIDGETVGEEQGEIYLQNMESPESVSFS